jgi:hypothetical protein
MRSITSGVEAVLGRYALCLEPCAGDLMVALPVIAVEMLRNTSGALSV